jgi:cytochrome c oxidase subunit 3
MATTIPPPQAEELPEQDRPTPGGAGNGGLGNLVPADGTMQVMQGYSPPASSSAIWVFIASICMSFAAFTSALIVRQGAAADWRHITLPSVLFFSTLMLFASSFTLDVARRRVAAFMKGAEKDAGVPKFWLYATLGLGLLFVAGQYMAWLQLRSQGLYLATNPNSSFFYVLTAIHALHVMGGLGGLLRVIRRFGQSRLRRSTLTATSYYWHFMGVLWIYLFALLRARI